MHAADDELEGDEVEDDGGDAEEALKVDLDAAPNEENAEDDGDGDAPRRVPVKESSSGGVESDGGEDEDSLNTLTEDEEEDEEEEPDF